MSRRLVVPVLWLAWNLTSTAMPVAAENLRILDQRTYINANSILMLVTNGGLYGQDFSGLFGYQYGTFYPYTSVQNIRNGTEIKSPLFSAGIWLGGKVGAETRVTIADFSSEYWPGPMIGGTFDPGGDTATAYRVYKLYSDSMGSNPNRDYLEWPAEQGAPVDRFGYPLLRGSQTLWSVFNDANPSRHSLIAGSTAPLGLEIRHMTWAGSTAGRERVIYMEYRIFNKGSNSVTGLYLSPYYDPDLGYAEDDLTGCDTLSDIIYCYNGSDSDAVYGINTSSYRDQISLRSNRLFPR